MSDANSTDESVVESTLSNIEQTIESDTISVRTESDTHIGIEKKAGGWLENECSKIIEFAGFKTEREVKISFDDTSSDHFRIDVLGKYENLTIFLEAKDYNEMKVDSKIVFTLIGQINHYRLEHPEEHVIGILATSAKNIEGINDGINRKLKAEGCYLWDGLKIQSLKDNITQYRDETLFREHLMHEIEYFESDSKNEEIIDPHQGKPRFFIRMNFYSIPEMQYVGNMFHFNSIINDLENQLKDTKINLVRTRYNVFKDIDNKNRFHFVCDFQLDKTLGDIEKHAAKNQQGWFSRNKISSNGLMQEDFGRACKKVIQNTYGIEDEYHLNYPVKIIAQRKDVLGSYMKYS